MKNSLSPSGLGAAGLILAIGLLSSVPWAAEISKLPAVSADGTQVALHEYFSDSMGMDSRVVFAKTGSTEGRTLHIVCTECRRRDSAKIDERLRAGKFVPMQIVRFPDKWSSRKISLGGLQIDARRKGERIHFGATKNGKPAGRASFEEHDGRVTAVAAVFGDRRWLYLELAVGNGTTWGVVELVEK